MAVTGLDNLPRAKSNKQGRTFGPKVLGIKKPDLGLSPLTVQGPRAVAQKKIVRTDGPPQEFDMTRFTRPEWYVYWYLEHRKRWIHGIDFKFQSSMLGGRAEIGGLVSDFEVWRTFYPPGLVMPVHGFFWHRLTSDQRAKDQDQKNRLENLGYVVAAVMEEDVVREVEGGGYSRTIEDALKGIQRFKD